MNFISLIKWSVFFFLFSRDIHEIFSQSIVINNIIVITHKYVNFFGWLPSFSNFLQSGLD